MGLRLNLCSIVSFASRESGLAVVPPGKGPNPKFQGNLENSFTKSRWSHALQASAHYIHMSSIFLQGISKIGDISPPPSAYTQKKYFVISVKVKVFSLSKHFCFMTWSQKERQSPSCCHYFGRGHNRLCSWLILGSTLRDLSAVLRAS